MSMEQLLEIVSLGLMIGLTIDWLFSIRKLFNDEEKIKKKS